MEFLPDLNSLAPQKNLTNMERKEIYDLLLKQSNNGHTKRGSIISVVASFGVTPRTISRIWNQSKDNLAKGLVADVSSRMPRRVGRKRVQIDLSRMTRIANKSRTNIRSLAKALGESKTVVHGLIKMGKIRCHSNALKPYLTEGNKKARLEYCILMLDPISLNSNPMFRDMFDYVHIDEKWFYMSRTTQKYYLLPEDKDPHRTCKSKKIIEKVMFLAATARPRFDSSGNLLFFGKIGIFPFTFKEPAKRNSKNQVAVTMETKPILSITKEVTRAYLIDKVLPAIREKWPSFGSRTIFIHQDNAKPHINPSDSQFREAASRDGFDIQLTFQPPNSLDMNALDLGFFRSIQSLQHESVPSTIDQLVVAVEKAYDDLSSHCLNRVFVSLQLCMVEVMNSLGGNNFKLKHIGKNMLEKNGELPLQVSCDVDLVEKVKEYLSIMVAFDGGWIFS